MLNKRDQREAVWWYNILFLLFFHFYILYHESNNNNDDGDDKLSVCSIFPNKVFYRKTADWFLSLLFNK